MPCSPRPPEAAVTVRRVARIGDLELDLTRPATQRQMRAGRSGGVLERVGQSLLSDPKDCQLHAVGEPVRISLDIHRHRDARGVHVREQLVEPAEARLGLERVR